MSSGFQVEADAVAAHAREVAALAGRVAAAAEAGQAARASDGEAYGLIGQVFARQATTSAETAVRGLGGTARAGHAIAAGLEATAEYYRQTERTNSAMLGGGP